MLPVWAAGWTGPAGGAGRVREREQHGTCGAGAGADVGGLVQSGGVVVVQLRWRRGTVGR